MMNSTQLLTPVNSSTDAAPAPEQLSAAGLPAWPSPAFPAFPLQMPDAETLAALPIQRTKQRPRYTDWQKDMLALYYSLADGPESRDWLSPRVGLSSRSKLHNMASRDQKTRRFQEGAYRPSEDVTQLDRRMDPATTVFSEDLDNHLRRSFSSKQPLADIAFFNCYTEIAAAYRARQLGLRKPCQYWDLRYVCRWLGISKAELEAIGRPKGLKVLACCNKRGKIGIYLVEARTLADTLAREGVAAQLVELRNADKFFIREVIESALSVAQGLAEWEICPWISYAHTSLYPYWEMSLGMSYDGSDPAIRTGFYPENLLPDRIHLCDASSPPPNPADPEREQMRAQRRGRGIDAHDQAS
jgi:hypothetical protein